MSQFASVGKESEIKWSVDESSLFYFDRVGDLNLRHYVLDY